MISLDKGKFETLFGDEWSHKNKRLMLFIEATPSSKVVKRVVTPPLVGSAVGGTLGGLIGSFGGPKGTAIGARSGLGVGFLAGSTYAGYQARSAYKKWLKQYRGEAVLEEFDESIARQTSMQEFICPLTKKLMHYPFIDPWGHSYERIAIEKWVKMHKTSPKSHASMTLADLRPNYALMGKQAKFYKDLVQRETSQIVLTELQKKGIEALMKDLDNQMKNCFDAENRMLHTLFSQGKISMRTYTSELNLIAESFNQ